MTSLQGVIDPRGNRANANASLYTDPVARVVPNKLHGRWSELINPTAIILFLTELSQFPGQREHPAHHESSRSSVVPPILTKIPIEALLPNRLVPPTSITLCLRLCAPPFSFYKSNRNDNSENWDLIFSFFRVLCFWTQNMSQCKERSPRNNYLLLFLEGKTMQVIINWAQDPLHDVGWTAVMKLWEGQNI